MAHAGCALLATGPHTDTRVIGRQARSRNSAACTCPTKPERRGDEPVPQCQVATASPAASIASSGAPTLRRVGERVSTAVQRPAASRQRARTTHTWRRTSVPPILRRWVPAVCRHTTRVLPSWSTATRGSMATPVRGEMRTGLSHRPSRPRTVTTMARRAHGPCTHAMAAPPPAP